MPIVTTIIFRYLTNADFFNMYKPRGSETGGGGQTYVDFPTSSITLADWEGFFSQIPGTIRQEGTQGPAWRVPVRSVGVPDRLQNVRFYQRRPQSVSVANQTLDRPQANRIEAWHPRYGFPEPANPSDRRQCPPGLVVFFARADDETIWAGWLLNDQTVVRTWEPSLTGALGQLLVMPTGNSNRSGVLSTRLWLDPLNAARPFGQVENNDGASESSSSVTPSLAPSRVPPSSDTQRAERSGAKASDGQGHQLDPKRRAAVEKYAMDRAKEAYPGADDTSRTEPFDLRTLQDGQEVRVEVKGTVGAGNVILLTANEVQNAHGIDWRTDLFIVFDIQLEVLGGEFVASDGEVRVIRGWVPHEDHLIPTQFRYSVPTS
jgi:hypothetical protein